MLWAFEISLVDDDELGSIAGDGGDGRPNMDDGVNGCELSDDCDDEIEYESLVQPLASN